MAPMRHYKEVTTKGDGKASPPRSLRALRKKNALPPRAPRTRRKGTASTRRTPREY